MDAIEMENKSEEEELVEPEDLSAVLDKYYRDAEA